MRELYTPDDLTNWAACSQEAGAPLKLAVLGWPVAHSLSPVFQNAALARLGRPERYVRIETPPERLAETVTAMRAAGFTGANVTIPHKQAVLPLCDDADPLARRIGAANTLDFRSGRAAAFNTDAPAFARVIRDEFGMDLRDLRVLILGAGGGAGAAFAHQCAAESCERLVLVNRTPSKARDLAAALAPSFGGAKVDGPAARLCAREWRDDILREELETIDLIVNATPLGLRRTDPSPLHESLISPHHLVFDSVYGRGRTPLTEAARRAGARAIDGLPLLVEQGALAFEIWFDAEAPRAVMRDALKSAAAA